MAKHTGRRASHREESCAAFAAGQRRVNEAAQYDLALLAHLIILWPRMAQKAIPNGLVGNQPSRNASVNCCGPIKIMHYIERGQMVKTALSIAGSDSCGGAGIQADIKTMTMNGVYAMSAITALTAQNTTGIRGIQESSPSCLQAQIDAVFEDIFPDAVKIGMVSSAALIQVIADRLRFYQAKNIVLDPVMVSTSGSKLLKSDAVSALTRELLPIATLATPNIPEAEVLAGMPISNKTDMQGAAKQISEAYGCAVLLKGGHRIDDAHDLLYGHGEYHWFEGARINNPNAHGTGCTLSSAIASNLAKGFDLAESVKRAKDYVSCALAAMLDLGQGSGPVQHNFDLNSRFADGI